MLDIGGVLRCRIYQHTPGFFHIYILLSDLGIEPGEVMIANETFLSQYRKEEWKGDWYTRLYTNCARRKGNKRKRALTKIPISCFANLEFYTEGVVILDGEMKMGVWFEQKISASFILPVIKERSKIQNGLIYKDEYWKT